MALEVPGRTFPQRRRVDAGGCLTLRVVARGTFRPQGGPFDVRPLRYRPVRALRGGARGMAAAYGLRDGEVEITIFACDEAASDQDIEWSMHAARGLVGVDDETGDFMRMVQAHPLLGPLAREFDARMTRLPTVFEGFARAVIEQLVTTFEAKASTRRLFGHAGRTIDGTTLRAAPSPEDVLGVPPWKLHAMGIGSRRSRTLREGARRGAALERLRQFEPADAVQRLQTLPGVGPWTANYVARASLGWSDAVPVGDFHAPSLVTAALTGEEGDDDAMLEALAPFRPHRARVVHVITQALIADVLPGFERTRRRLPRVDPHRREPWKY